MGNKFCRRSQRQDDTTGIDRDARSEEDLTTPNDAGGEEVPCDGWMQWFLGASEKDVIREKHNFIDTAGCFINIKTGRSWSPGIFDLPSIATLRERVEKMEKIRADGPLCPLNVVDGTDIGSYQGVFRTSDKAMIQIASNMHCLENGSERCPADIGHLVEGYCRDSTQGPAAAFGVPGASLLRAHYAFKERYPDDVSRWGQAAHRQVNLLEGICREAEKCQHYVGGCMNGKAQLYGGEDHVTRDLIDHVASQVRVGLHSDAQVVFTRGSGRRTIKAIDKPQLVDQLCTATLCYGFCDREHPLPKEAMENLTIALLRAAYEGTYLAAIARGRRKLLLTLIGGASFANPHELILRELKRAHDLYASHPASQLEEVQLVLHTGGVAAAYREQLSL